MKRVFTTAMGGLPLLKHREVKGATSGSTNTATVIAVAITASGVTRVATGTTVVATFTATAAHHLATGQYVAVSGATPAAYNGNFEVTVTSATVFTYTFTKATDPGAVSGTVVATYSPQAQWAVFQADAANAAAISIGPDVNSDLYPVVAGDFYTIQCPSGAKFDLGDWYVKSASASQAYRVLFI